MKAEQPKVAQAGVVGTYEGFQAAHHSVGVPLQEGGLPQQDTAGDDLAGHPNMLCKPGKHPRFAHRIIRHWTHRQSIWIAGRVSKVSEWVGERVGGWVGG